MLAKPSFLVELGHYFQKESYVHNTRAHSFHFVRSYLPAHVIAEPIAILWFFLQTLS